MEPDDLLPCWKSIWKKNHSASSIHSIPWHISLRWLNNILSFTAWSLNPGPLADNVTRTWSIPVNTSYLRFLKILMKLSLNPSNTQGRRTEPWMQMFTHTYARHYMRERIRQFHDLSPLHQEKSFSLHMNKRAPRPSERTVQLIGIMADVHDFKKFHEWICSAKRASITRISCCLTAT